MAEQAGFSVSYFNRMFFEATGKTVMDFASSYKLIQAAVALRTSGQSILDIALDFGYANPENFSRAFQARYGQPPSSYRKAHASRALSWKELSTGVAIRRFEAEFPELERISMEEFTDALYLKSPVRYAFQIYFTSQIDCAAFRLSEDEFAYVDEYRPNEMHVALFTADGNIGKYVGMLGRLKDCRIELNPELDFILPGDRYGFAQAKWYSDYAFLQEQVAPAPLPGCEVRELTQADLPAMQQFSKMHEAPLAGVFEQNRQVGNYAGMHFYGLFRDGVLIGSAIPQLQRANGTASYELGDMVLPADVDDALLRGFWTQLIKMALEGDLLPTVNAVGDEEKLLSHRNCERMGYTRVAQRVFLWN